MKKATKAEVLAVAQRAVDLVGRVLATNREEQEARDARALAEYARGRKERADRRRKETAGRRAA